MTRALPGWAEWAGDSERPPWTVGVEEEVMLLDPATWAIAPVIDDLLPTLSAELAAHVSAETNAGTLEIATGVHDTVAQAVAELGALRARLRSELLDAGLRPAAAGTHALSEWEDTRVSAGARYQLLETSLQELVRREPTFALHVHVGVPDPELAIETMNRMRAHLPALLALSANSPFLRGRDSGLASTRTPLFQAFPRVGIPRRFSSYRDWVDAIDPLIGAGAIPEPTFLWWDVRPQPRLGTLEVRIMDAQSRLEDVAALIALTQCLVVMEATDRFASDAALDAAEVLDENRFLAARDGMGAAFVDARSHERVDAVVVVEELVRGSRFHAQRLGCGRELALVTQMAADPPAERQRAVARLDGLPLLMQTLAGAYCAADHAMPDSRAAVA